MEIHSFFLNSMLKTKQFVSAVLLAFMLAASILTVLIPKSVSAATVAAEALVKVKADSDKADKAYTDAQAKVALTKAASALAAATALKTKTDSDIAAAAKAKVDYNQALKDAAAAKIDVSEAKAELGKATKAKLAEDAVNKDEAAFSGNLICLGKASDKREVAIGSARTTYSAAVAKAYSDRLTTIKGIYTNAKNRAEVKKGLNDSWTAFKVAVPAATKVLKKARDAAWKTYSTELTACKVSKDFADQFGQGFEAKGE